jgi:hypothetical protein
MSAPESSSPAASRRFALDALDLVVLCALGLGARLYDVTARYPAFFVSRRSSWGDVVLVILLLSLVLPGLFVTAAGLPRWCMGARAGRVAHLGLVFLLCAAIALPPLKRVEWLSGLQVVAAAVLVGVLATLMLARLKAARFALRLLWPAILLGPGLLVGRAPWSQLASLRAEAALRAVEIGNPAPVVFVVFDELSGASLLDEEGEIDAARYPNFARLAAESTWFRNATTNSNYTEAAVPAMLAGLRPPVPVPAATFDEYPRNLLALLAPSYEATVREHFTQLYPLLDGSGRPIRTSTLARWRTLLCDLVILEMHLLLPADGPWELPEIGGRWSRFGQEPDDDPAAAERPDRAAKFGRFVASIERSDRPTLHFIHALLPHVPYAYTPSGREYPGLPLPPEKRRNPATSDALVGRREHPTKQWLDEEWTTVQARQRYLLQVGFVDRLLGTLLDRLEEVGLYDRCLLVVTSDHGRTFRSRREHDPSLDPVDPALASIPLFVKRPGRRDAERSDRNVQSFDLLPTLAEVLQIDIEWPIDGRSAWDADAPEPAEKEILVQWDTGPARRRRLPAAFPEKDDARREMLALFGSGEKDDPWGGVYRVGPNRELVGRRLDELAVETAPGGRGQWTFTPIGPGSGDPFDGARLPSYLGGRLQPEPPRRLPVDLALAVNGTVRAVTRTYRIAGLEESWTAMIPESAIRPGRNDLRLFVVVEKNGEARLYPVVHPNR